MHIGAKQIKAYKYYPARFIPITERFDNTGGAECTEKISSLSSKKSIFQEKLLNVLLYIRNQNAFPYKEPSKPCLEQYKCDGV